MPALLAGVVLAGGPAVAAGLADAEQHQDKAAVRTLLRDRADVNAKQPDGATALHWASHWDDLEMAQALIAAHADVNAKNDYGATPLSLACTNGNAEMVENLLAAGADPNLALPSGATPLMLCARSGNPAAVKALVARHADVNAKDIERGQTALMWAVAEKHPAAVQALIASGADVHARSAGGFTPLLFAARIGDTESAALLIAAGEDINEKAPNGMTPLVLASASGQEAFGIAILEKGADPNARDGIGATALHYTMTKGITGLGGIVYANYVEYLFRPDLTGLVKALLAHHANPNVQIEKAPRLGGVSATNAIGATPFLLAAASPNVEAMRMLADAGADTKIATKDKLTPLMAAAGVSRGQDFTEDERRISFQAVKLAVELGADVNASNENGLTALHGAASNGMDDVVAFLADKGAKLDARDRYQQTPLSISTGIRLPWIPKGDELGEIIRPSTAALLKKLGATPVETPGYFKPPAGESEAFKFNQSQRYGGADPEAN